MEGKGKGKEEELRLVLERVEIPDDLKYEIMLQMPMKSAFGLFSLNKNWASTFGSDFMSKTKRKPRVLISSFEKGKRWFNSISENQLWEINTKAQSHSLLHLESSSFICQPVSGLVCCHQGAKSLICNPCSGIFFMLPEISPASYYYFFGYDKVKKQLKVIAVALNNSSRQVITVGQDTWRETDYPIEARHQPGKPGICVDGKLYYEANSSNMWTHCIMCFDLATEESTRIPLPTQVRHEFRGRENSYLVKVGNKFAVFQAIAPTPPFTLWFLSDDGVWSNWKIQIPKWEEVVGDVPVRCLGTHTWGELVFGSTKVQGGSSSVYLFVYRFATEHLKKVTVQGNFGTTEAEVSIFLEFTENLALTSEAGGYDL